MITDRVLAVVLSPVVWLLQAFPDIPWPSWFAVDGPDSIVIQAGVWGESVGALSGWFPVAEFFDAGGIVFVASAAGAAIKIVRIVVSLLTAGGGSAA